MKLPLDKARRTETAQAFRLFRQSKNKERAKLLFSYWRIQNCSREAKLRVPDPASEIASLRTRNKELVAALKETVRLVSCDSCDGRKERGRDGKCEACWQDTAAARALIAKEEARK